MKKKKAKKCEYARELNKNLSEEEKSQKWQYGREQYRKQKF